MNIKYPKVPTRYPYLLKTYKEKNKIKTDFDLINKFDDGIKDNDQKIIKRFEGEVLKSSEVPIPSSFQSWKTGESRPANIAQKTAILQALGCQYIDTFVSDYDSYSDNNLKNDIYSQKYGAMLTEYFEELKDTFSQVLTELRDSLESSKNTTIGINQIANKIRDKYSKSTSQLGKAADFIKTLYLFNFYLRVANFPITFQKDILQQTIELNTLSRIFVKKNWWKDDHDKNRKDFLSQKSDLEVVNMLISKYDTYFENLMYVIQLVSSPGNNSYEYVAELSYPSLYKCIANDVNAQYDYTDDNKLLFNVTVDVLVDAMKLEISHIKKNCHYDPSKRLFTAFDTLVKVDESFSDDFFTEGLEIDVNSML